jgi:CDP-diacylglycerol--glycerol-3-phosphate 3-phosphatidyltransferase
MLGEKVNPLPNILTTFRLVAGLCMFGLMASTIGGVPLFTGDIFEMRLWALGAFVVAALTDFLDGWLARHLKAESEWGAILDPIADKILVAGTILGLTAMSPNPITLLPLGLILFREFAVSALRESAAAKGVRIKVITLAKWKTFVQMLALGLLLFDECWPALNLEPALEPSFALFAQGLIWLAAILTTWTGITYFLEARKTIWAHDLETHPRG